MVRHGRDFERGHSLVMVGLFVFKVILVPEGWMDWRAVKVDAARGLETWCKELRWEMVFWRGDGEKRMELGSMYKTSTGLGDRLGYWLDRAGGREKGWRWTMPSFQSFEAWWLLLCDKLFLKYFYLLYLYTLYVSIFIYFKIFLLSKYLMKYNICRKKWTNLKCRAQRIFTSGTWQVSCIQRTRAGGPMSLSHQSSPRHGRDFRQGRNMSSGWLVLHVLKLYLNGIIQYIRFYIWLLWLGIMFVRIIHIVACINSLFVLITT